ncbi:hypothetical protein [Zhihengliuella halotolerans]|nr:hypothetical protein [Zhihengliuella halotolerans]
MNDRDAYQQRANELAEKRQTAHEKAAQIGALIVERDAQAVARTTPENES